MESIKSRQYINPRSNGFSLVEVLVTMTIGLVIMGMSISSYQFITGATQLKSAGDQVVNFLTDCNQTAISDNQQVECRFYRPSEEAGRGWALLQAVEAGQGIMKGNSSPYYLPSGVTFSESSALSTLIADLETEEDADNLIGIEDAEYHSFLIYADGTTNLTAESDTWHATLVNDDHDINSATPPDNYFTVRIDPFTGSLRTFRP